MEILVLIIALSSLIVSYLVYYNNSIADVVVYAQVDKSKPTIINLVIQNIGKGIARDIRFSCPQGIPEQAYGLTNLRDPLKLYSSGALVKGLPLLHPNEKLVYSWGQLGGLKEALNGKPLNLTVTYYSPLALQLRKRKIIKKFYLDPTVFEGVDISSTTFESNVNNSLQKIAQSLQKIADK